MSRSKLLALWTEIYRRPAPIKIRREFLIPFIAYKIQENAYGGLKESILSELRQIAERLNHSGGNPQITSRFRISPGTRLLRQWHGDSHEVVVTNTGYEYRGERYKSLSQIARKITGTPWSGPAFFGMKAKSDRDDAK